MSWEERGEKGHISDRNDVLRDHFAGNVCELSLHIELKRRLIFQPEKAFLNFVKRLLCGLRRMTKS